MNNSYMNALLVLLVLTTGLQVILAIRLITISKIIKSIDFRAECFNNYFKSLLQKVGNMQYDVDAIYQIQVRNTKEIEKMRKEWFKKKKKNKEVDEQ